MAGTAVERIWDISDSQGQILALTFMSQPLKPCEMFPLRSEEENIEGKWIFQNSPRGRAAPAARSSAKSGT